MKVLPQHIIVASGFKQCTTTIVCDENILYILRYNLAYIHDVCRFYTMKYLKVNETQMQKIKT